MRAVLVPTVVSLLMLGACSSSPDAVETSRSPAPRVAPSQEPDENVEGEPQPAAGPPAASDKAAAKICDGLAEVDDAESPEDALKRLATKARREGVRFHRFVSLLHLAYVQGNVEKAYGYIDRLSALCENVPGRRNS